MGRFWRKAAIRAESEAVFRVGTADS